MADFKDPDLKQDPDLGNSDLGTIPDDPNQAGLGDVSLRGGASDLDAVELSRQPLGAPSSETFEAAEPPRRPGGLARFWPLLLAALLGIAAAVFYFLREPPEELEPEPAVVEAVSPPVAPPVEARAPVETFDVELPELDESDGVVRELLERLSAHPEMGRFLEPANDILRRAVVTVDNIAEGTSPAPHLPFLRPSAEFRVAQQGEDIVADARSYRRYDAVSSLVSAVDPELGARLYHTVKPLLQQAYQELGYPDRDFEDTLRKAADALLAVPLLSGNVLLEKRTLGYGYADAELENLTPAQKQLLRMGPDNVELVQQKIRHLLDTISPDGANPEDANP